MILVPLQLHSDFKKVFYLLRGILFHHHLQLYYCKEKLLQPFLFA